MPKFVGYRCDNEKCGKVKGESNHWWAVAVTNYNDGMHEDNFKIYPGLTDREPVEIYCGVECLNRRINKWIEEQHAKATISK